MKKIYWRPKNISRTAVALIALLSVCGLVAVEFLQVTTRQPFYSDKIAAAQLARQAMEEIRQERLRRYGPVDQDTDPADSGLIGVAMSQITSNTGYLAAKQTSINPNFAAVLVQMLRRAGVEKGDVVAVGLSGSFPAINLSTYAALDTLQADPVVITSVSSSQWGANRDDFMWLDMESLLYRRKTFPFQTVAASLGGVEDRGLGMNRQGREVMMEGISRNGPLLIRSSTMTESINQRMQIFREHASGRPVRAYINVGGGATSVGTFVGKRAFSPGLNRFLPPGASNIDSVMTRFLEDGTPVIHMVQIDRLARQYGLPLQPQTMPAVGDGKIFSREQYNQPMAAVILLLILLALYAFVRSDWGFRIAKNPPKLDSGRNHPEQMV